MAMQWACTLLAVVCACALNSISRRARAKRPSTKAAILARRVLFFQLPIRRMWFQIWGGLTTLDLAISGLSLGLAMCVLVLAIQRTLEKYPSGENTVGLSFD